jgi:LysR family nitrogen assimilation transcriptional regulator
MALDNLKLFLAVANTGSFSKAAQISGVTQSAISKRILQLELQLGHRLFERHGRGASLTNAGRLLVRHAESLLRDADQLAQVIGGELSQAQGIVRLALQASISWPLMQHLHPALHQNHPLIHLQVVEAPTRQVVDLIQEGRVDLGVLSDWGQETLPQVERLFTSPLLLVGPAGDKVTGAASVRFEQLANTPLIVSPMPNGARVWLEAAAKEAGRALNVIMEVHSVHLIKKMVIAGWGYTVALNESVQDDVAQGTLSASPIIAPAMSQNFYLSVSNQRKGSGAVGVVAKLIRDWRKG